MNNILAQGVFPEIQDSFSLIDKSFLELNLPYLIMGFLLIVVLIVIFYYIFKPKPVVLSAYQKAKLALEALSEDIEASVYVQNLSDIVRAFLEEHYNLPAPERTTSEFMLLANKSMLIESEVKESLQRLLELSDVVKFAKYDISIEQKKLIFQSALELVEKSQEQKKDK